jgi:DNA-binding NarL/FixJ family response regulator
LRKWGERWTFDVTPTRRTVVLFDHSQLWLHSLERVLPAIGVAVAAKTTSPDEAVALVEEYRPQLLIAGVDGGSNAAGDLSCIRRALEQATELQVIVWSSVNEVDAVKAAFAAGAAVYVLKTARSDDILLAIRQTYERSIYLAKALPLGEEAAPGGATDASRILTRREHEILRLLAEGYSNAQLAEMLWVTAETVKFHLSNIYEKLHVANRTEASHWAHVNGVVTGAA